MSWLLLSGKPLVVVITLGLSSWTAAVVIGLIDRDTRDWEGGKGGRVRKGWWWWRHRAEREGVGRGRRHGG